MRRVLVDYARAHSSNSEAAVCSESRCRRNWPSPRRSLSRYKEIDELLKKLEKQNPRQARVIELRYFGGLSFEEIGTLLQLTSRTPQKSGLGPGEDLAAGSTATGRKSARSTGIKIWEG